MTWTKQRTYDRDTMLRSRAAWDAGDFGPEWRPWRHLAAMRAGIIFPPDGTAWDSWSDDSPSQRAILIRAIRETPTALRRAIEAPGVRSWAAVIERLLRHRDRLADDADQRELDWSRTKRTPTPTPLADVLGTVADSLGVTR